MRRASSTRRPRADTESERHDRWLVSYADFITLMFALFVVMYAMSSVNTGKYRVLSETLGAIFADPTPVHGAAAAGAVPGGGPIDSAGSPAMALEAAALDATPLPAGTPFDAERVAARVDDALQQVLAPGQGRVRRVEDRVEIELDAEMLFDPASARVAEAARPVVREVAAALRALPAAIRVEGFTDDRPIASARFPSNWELSAARAASVVRLLAELGVDPARMAAIGYAQHRPVADNATAEGRARNRRVVIVVAGETESAQSQPEGRAAHGLLRIDRLPQRQGPQL